MDELVCWFQLLKYGKLPLDEVMRYNFIGKNMKEPMNTLATTTRMSSKGQVVIPEAIRKQLNLKAGMQFVVVGEGDVVILKAIASLDLDTFNALIQKARQQAKPAGLKRTDIANAVSKARTHN